MILLGVGQDGEPVLMEKIHQACVLIHCAGNAMSPFEFNGDIDKSAEDNAREFAKLLYCFKVEDDLNRELGL